MGKASGRKREQHRDGNHDRVLIAGSVPAPNFEGAMVEATRYAFAMVTSVHASPEDLPGLIEELAPDRAVATRQSASSARALSTPGIDQGNPS